MTDGTAERRKEAAARRAVMLVEDGMTLGLGTGSTADWFLRVLGQRIAEEGLRVTGVATSARTARAAERLAIPLLPLDEAGTLDLCIDGADEADPDLNLIKGGGGALLREKLVAEAAERLIVIADPDKEVERLGRFPLPVEVVGFGLATTERRMERCLSDLGLAGRRITLRHGEDGPFETDEGHRIFDLHLGEIPDAPALAQALKSLTGVVETGLFIEMAETLIVGLEDGTARVRSRAP